MEGMEEKTIIAVGIPAKENVRYKGKSYKAGEDVLVDYEDIDDLIASGVLDVDVAQEAKVGKAAAEAEAHARLDDAQNELKAENVQLSGELDAARSEIARLTDENGGLQARINGQEHQINLLTDQKATLQIENDKAAATIETLTREKAALEKAAKAKK